MFYDIALYLSKQLLWQALLIAFPVVLVATLCGFCTSILQVVTQIQDSTLSFVPKILAVVLVLMFCGEWMLHSLLDFSKNLIESIPEAVR